MNIQATKFNLHKCSPKANANCSGLCALPRRTGLFFYGLGCCLTQHDYKLSRTHHHSSDRETIMRQTMAKQYTDTHTLWVKAIQKGNIFSCFKSFPTTLLPGCLPLIILLYYIGAPHEMCWEVLHKQLTEGYFLSPKSLQYKSV